MAPFDDETISPNNTQPDDSQVIEDFLYLLLDAYLENKKSSELL